MTKSHVLIAALILLALPFAACSAIDDGTSVDDESAAVTAGQPIETEAIVPIGPVNQQCGPVVCTGKTHCCNASCGLCTPPGVECTQQVCAF